MTTQPTLTTFTCADCGIVGDAFPNGSTSAYTVRAADNGHLCKACGNRSELRALAAGDRMFGYLACSDRGEHVGQEWQGVSGVLLGRVTRVGAVHPFSQRGRYGDVRRYVRVRDVDGKDWHGTAGSGLWASLRRCK